ncbi:MAG TPA: tail fiber protein [Xanthobacteraceae bacterium]|nr:tail fiber protein [Xanthobacteraceae bacterium]
MARTRARQLGSGATVPYMGQIASFPFSFAPSGWAACSGQLLPINRYITLFSLLSTTYGGNGTTDFKLPNLPPRSPSGPWYCIAIDGAYPPRG